MSDTDDKDVSVDIQIESTPVTAQPRKLRAIWSAAMAWEEFGTMPVEKDLNLLYRSGLKKRWKRLGG